MYPSSFMCKGLMILKYLCPYAPATDMIKKEKKAKRIHRKLLHKYRLVILNESTYEEKISFKLNRLNVFVTGSVFAFVLIVITTLIIAFTPLREYIPGYPSDQLKREANKLSGQVDAFSQELSQNSLYVSHISKVLKGEVHWDDVANDTIPESFKVDPSTVDIALAKEEVDLREEVVIEDKYNFFERSKISTSALLYAPITGSLTNPYNAQNKHFGIDVVAPEGTTVKATADGTVIFAEWTANTGYVILLKHKEGLLSVYKHNKTLYKQQGDLVKVGEIIAEVGNTGHLTTGPHLHFELWSNGYPVNPIHYIDFE